MYDELPPLRMHSTLVQAFDTARFHDRTQADAPQVSIARSEVLLNLVFGRTVVLPAGHIADSPAVVAVVREALAGYQRAVRRQRTPPGPQWLFRVALEPEFRDYSDYIGKYVHGIAPTVILPPADGTDPRAFAHVAQLYLNGRFDDLEKILNRAGYSEYAELVHGHVDGAVVRPLGNAGPPDLVRHIESWLPRLERSGAAELAREIAAGMPIATEGHFRHQRGSWYGQKSRFPAAWPLVRTLLDEALYIRLGDYYGIEHPAFVTQEIDASIDTLLHGGRPAALVAASADLPEQPFQPVSIDWPTVGELLADEKFGRNARHLTTTIDRAETRDEISDAIAAHAEFVQQYFTDLAFDLQEGRVVIRRREASLGPAAIGFAAGAITEVLVGTFLPGVVAHQPPGLLTTAATLAAHSFAQQESRLFRRGDTDTVARHNAEATRSARLQVSRWTKPVRRNRAMTLPIGPEPGSQPA